MVNYNFEPVVCLPTGAGAGGHGSAGPAADHRADAGQVPTGAAAAGEGGPQLLGLAVEECLVCCVSGVKGRAAVGLVWKRAVHGFQGQQTSGLSRSQDPSTQLACFCAQAAPLAQHARSAHSTATPPWCRRGMLCTRTSRTAPQTPLPLSFAASGAWQCGGTTLRPAFQTAV